MLSVHYLLFCHGVVLVGTTTRELKRGFLEKGGGGGREKEKIVAYPTNIAEVSTRHLSVLVCCNYVVYEDRILVSVSRTSKLRVVAELDRTFFFFPWVCRWVSSEPRRGRVNPLPSSSSSYLACM